MMNIVSIIAHGKNVFIIHLHFSDFEWFVRFIFQRHFEANVDQISTNFDQISTNFDQIDNKKQFCQCRHFVDKLIPIFCDLQQIFHKIFHKVQQICTKFVDISTIFNKFRQIIQHSAAQFPPARRPILTTQGPILAHSSTRRVFNVSEIDTILHLYIHIWCKPSKKF